MKKGRTLSELAQELEWQRNAKKDYLVGTPNIIMDSLVDRHQITLKNDQFCTFGIRLIGV